MVKRAAAVVFVAFATLLTRQALGQQAATSRAAALDAIRSTVVLVRAVDAAGDTLVGNGVLIGKPGQIVTEGAILEGAASVTVVVSGDGSALTATVVSVDSVTGIAVLRAPGVRTQPAAVAQRSLKTNDSVIVVTLTPGDPPALVRGKVRKVAAFVGTELATLSTNLTLETNGAPVVNVAGEVAGIAFASEVDGESRTYSIPARAFEHLIVGGEPKQRPAAVAVAPQGTPASANSQDRSKAASARTAEPSAPGFSASGLEFEQTILAIYAGQFQNVDIKREEMKFSMLLGAYINACAIQCDAYLPPDKVELTTNECVRESRMVNGYGVQVGPSTCVQWETRGTGLFADPAMYEASRQLHAESIGTNIGEMMQSMTQGNPMAAAGDMIGTMQKLRSDMKALLERNGCASPGTKRFQGNLRRFALREAPIKLAGAEAAAIVSATRPVFDSNIVDANFTRLLDDLIADQAKSWMLNRYIDGSVTHVSVTARDAQGRPVKVEGNYSFNGANGQTLGSVVVQFSDGIPECMFFFDAPQNCRTPGRKIVASYAKGGYPAP